MWRQNLGQIKPHEGERAISYSKPAQAGKNVELDPVEIGQPLVSSKSGSFP
jgi:hypothetical protein